LKRHLNNGFTGLLPPITIFCNSKMRQSTRIPVQGLNLRTEKGYAHALTADSLTLRSEAGNDDRGNAPGWNRSVFCRAPFSY
jgi:hypothetical protein